jgi:hypothetical protein
MQQATKEITEAAAAAGTSAATTVLPTFISAIHVRPPDTHGTETVL